MSGLAFEEQMLMAHAAKTTYVTVEEIVEGNIMEDLQLKAAAIPESI